MVDFHRKFSFKFVMYFVHIFALLLTSPHLSHSLVLFFSPMVLFSFAQTHLGGGREDMKHLSF